MMSLRKNTIYNYIGRIYISLISIAMLPVYLRYFGAETFGLVSLFTVMQSWVRILDMGLMPTLSREVAYYRNQKDGLSNIRQVLRSLEIIFFILIIIIVLCILFGSHWIAHHWLRVEKLDYQAVTSCITMMGIMIGFHWFSDLYRSGILGMEQQVWLNCFNIFIVTLQYGGGCAILIFISTMPVLFFGYQLMIIILEFLVLGIKFYKMIPTKKISFWNCRISLELIEKIFPFALGIAYTSILWTLFAESNNLLLSHILPLSTYGYFVLVITISNGIMQFSTPISEAILPRMTYLLAQGNKVGMVQLYRNATQLTAVIMFTMNGIVAIFGTELIYAWTANKEAANWTGPILFWYALGNGLLSISMFQYYLQYAYGKLKLHIIINTIFTLTTIPLLYFAAYQYSAIGAAITWFLIQVVTFIIVPPIIHHKYIPGLHRKWIIKDILPILTMIVIILFILKIISINFILMSRSEIFLIIFGFTSMSLTISSLASSTCRTFLLNFIGYNKI